MNGKMPFNGTGAFREFSKAWVLLALLPLLAYFNTFHHSFHYDDNIIWNKKILSHESYIGASPYHGPVEVLRDLRNRSILKLVFAANYHFSRFSTFGYHLTNTLIHIFASIGVFFLTGALLVYGPGDIPRRTRLHLSLTAASFFSLSPMATQGVTYIMGRSSSLATLTYLLCLLLFYRGLGQSGLPACIYFIGSLVLFIIGLGIKEIVITAPAVAMLSLYFFSGKSLAEMTRRHFPVLAVLAGLLGGYLLYRGGFRIPDAGRAVFGMGGESNPNLRYLITEINVIPRYYLRLLLFPFNQNLDPDFAYNIPFLSVKTLFSLSVILFLFLTAFSRRSIFGLMIGWFLITLAPTSSVIPLADPAIEHRLYLPCIGFFTALALFTGTCRLKGQWKILPLLILVLFFTTTLTRNRVWRDGLTLWTDAALKSPHKSRPFNNLGGALFRERKDFTGAILQYKKAIHLNPGSMDARKNLASAYFEAGMMDEAIRKFEHVYFLDRKSRPAVCGYLGDAYLVKGKLKKAARYFLEAVRWNPGETYGFMKLGEIFKRLGRPDKAEAMLKEGLARDPRDPYLKFHLAGISMLKKDYKKATALYREVIVSSPEFEPALLNLGIAYGKMGRFQEALASFKKALASNPNSEKVRLNLGILFQEKGDLKAALREFQGALALNPSNPDTYNRIGSLYFARSDYPRARKAFKKALDIRPGFPEARHNLEVADKALSAARNK